MSVEWDAQLSPPVSLNRVRYAKETLAVLAAWGLPQDVQLKLLGLPVSGGLRALARYCQGYDVPSAGAIDRRCECLLKIDAATRSMYPLSEASAAAWVRSPNPYFNERSPVEVMQALGLEGMQRILEHLDGDITW